MSHTCTFIFFLELHLKRQKEKGEININNLFCLTKVSKIVSFQLELPDLTNKNSGHPVKFQRNNE